MTEFGRWLDEGDAPPEVVELLRGARGSVGLPDAVRQRSRTRVAGLVALPAAAGAMTWMGHAALGAVLGATVTAAITVPRVVATYREARTSAAVAAASRAPAKHVARNAPAFVPTTPPVASDSPMFEPPPVADEARLTPKAELPSSDLAREAALLERAQRLVAKNPTAALRELRVHGAEFPHGALELERDFLTVDALVRLGRRTEAESLADTIQTRAPGSLYGRRLEHLLSEDTKARP
jgi:hypothetical protein